MSSFDDPAAAFPGTVVVVAPHMDDETLGCGALLAQLPGAERLHVVFVTDGARSPESRANDGVDVRAVRRAEALCATATLGVPAHNVTFLDRPDGLLRADASARTMLVDALVARTPDHVLVPFRFDRHPDHVTVNRIVREAVRAGSLRAQVSEYFVYPRWRLLRTRDVRDYVEADHTIRVDGAPVSARKRAALSCHVSQTTRFRKGQPRAVLTEDLIARVCAEPETFVRAKAGRVLARGRAWVPIAHRVEPVLKRWKDRLTGEWP